MMYFENGAKDWPGNILKYCSAYLYSTLIPKENLVTSLPKVLVNARHLLSFCVRVIYASV